MIYQINEQLLMATYSKTNLEKKKKTISSQLYYGILGISRRSVDHLVSIINDKNGPLLNNNS